MTESVIFDISDACSIRWNEFCSFWNNFKNFFFLRFPWNAAKMVKNLQCLKTLQICRLRHAEHHAKNRTPLCSLDHDTLFMNDPLTIQHKLHLSNLFAFITCKRQEKKEINLLSLYSSDTKSKSYHGRMNLSSLSKEHRCLCLSLVSLTLFFLFFLF